MFNGYPKGMQGVVATHARVILERLSRIAALVVRARVHVHRAYAGVHARYVIIFCRSHQMPKLEPGPYHWLLLVSYSDAICYFWTP